MTLSEFKAWFEGFTENINGQPNKKQWERICKRVKQIEKDQTPIIIERHIRPYWDRVWCTNGGTAVDAVSTLALNNTAIPQNEAYCMLGKADALEVAETSAV